MKTIKKEYINSNEFTDLMTIASNINDIAFQNNTLAIDNTYKALYNYATFETTLQDFIEDCVECIIYAALNQYSIKQLIDLLNENNIDIIEAPLKLNKITFRLIITITNKKQKIVYNREQYQESLTKQEIHDLFEKLSKKSKKLIYSQQNFHAAINYDDEKRDMNRTFNIITDGKINYKLLEEFLKDC